MVIIRIVGLVFLGGMLLLSGAALAGSKSRISSVTSINAGIQLPVVKGLRAKSIVGGVKLRWKAVEQSDGYRIYRKFGKGADKTTTWFDVAADQTRYRDTGLQAGVRYTYRISALQGRTKGPRSKRASATPKVKAEIGPSDTAL